MREIEVEAHREAGAPFNLESPRQLQELLFNKLQLPVMRKTPTGQPSTAEDVLEELAGSYALPRLILEYRAFAKLKSTYTDKLPLQVDPRTGRIHTSYHQAVAATGRLSSTDPNLQNIPIRTPEGRRIRQAFVAPPGHVLMLASNDPIETEQMQMEFARRHGIKEEDFRKQYHSFAVETNLQRAEQLTRRYKVEGVPLFVINGKYTADVGSAGGQPQLIALINDLVAREQKKQ